MARSNHLTWLVTTDHCVDSIEMQADRVRATASLCTASRRIFVITQRIRLVARRPARLLIAAALSAVLASPVLAAPPIVRIVHSFNGADGDRPSTEPPLAPGPLGTLFGVTMLGGATGEGALFFLDARDRFHLVESFSAGGGRGWMPNSVFFSEFGQLYGTTAFGGAYECGTAFRVTLTGQVNTIHSFDCVDGNQPSGRVVARDGFFYGSTGFGGGVGAGNVYRLAPAGDITVLHEVQQLFSNEAGMYWGLTRGLNDELIGATMGYDVGDFHGVVFKVDASGSKAILHTFEGGTDGSRPTSTPVVTADGTVYGTTMAGGIHDAGTLYRITPQGDYSVVHTFGGTEGLENHPAVPFGGVVLGRNGNLYGTTTNGGRDSYGTIYEFEPSSGEFRVLYQFTGDGGFANPQGGLVERGRGTFYGMTGAGGAFGLGTIYKIRVP
jgi:uncharacterized repeat protein (TIGR03803 family)